MASEEVFRAPLMGLSRPLKLATAKLPRKPGAGLESRPEERVTPRPAASSARAHRGASLPGTVARATDRRLSSAPTALRRVQAALLGPYGLLGSVETALLRPYGLLGSVETAPLRLDQFVIESMHCDRYLPFLVRHHARVILRGFAGMMST